MPELDIRFPVAVDSNYAVWTAFSSHCWPALYFADAQGRIRRYHFGEGGYSYSEILLRQLLVGAGSATQFSGAAPVVAAGGALAADVHDLKSSETHSGYRRSTNFASAGGSMPGSRHDYTTPRALRRNEWALTGEWTITEEAATLHAPHGKISLIPRPRSEPGDGPADSGRSRPIPSAH